MTTELALRRTVAVSWSLNSLCLGYGVAKPSVWLCGKACKLRQFNGFGSDYPLTFSCFGVPYRSVLEHLHVPWLFVALLETVCSFHEVPRCWSQRTGNYAGYTWSSPGGRALIRIHRHSLPCRSHLLPAAFASERAGRFFSPPQPMRLAPRAWCLKLYRKFWVTACTVARLTSAEVGRPSRSIGPHVRPTQLTRTYMTVGLRDAQEARESDGNSTVDTARVCGLCRRGGATSPQGQKGTHYG